MEGFKKYHYRSERKSIVDCPYDRPEITAQDTMQTQEEMEKRLVDYERVTNIENVKKGSQIRYVTMDKEGNQAFRVGGKLIKVEPEYIMLTNGRMYWSVQRYHYENEDHDEDDEPIFETIFWRKISKVEKLTAELKEKNKLIQKLTKFIGF